MRLLTEQNIKEAFVDNLEAVIKESFDIETVELSDIDKIKIEYIAYVNKKLIENSKNEVSRFVALINESLLAGDNIMLYAEERSSFQWIETELIIKTNNKSTNNDYNEYLISNFNPKDFAANLAKNILYIDRISLNRSFLASESFHDYYRDVLIRNKKLNKKDMERKNLGLGAIRSNSQDEFPSDIEGVITKELERFFLNVSKQWSQDKINLFNNNKAIMVESLYALQQEVFSDTVGKYKLNREKAFENISIENSDKPLLALAEMLWKFTGDIQTDPAFSEDGIKFLLKKSAHIYSFSKQEISPKLKDRWFDILKKCAKTRPELILENLNDNETYLWKSSFFKELNEVIKVLANTDIEIKIPVSSKIESAILHEKQLNELKNNKQVDNIKGDSNDNGIDKRLFEVSKIVTYKISPDNLIVVLRHEGYLNNSFFKIDDWLDKVNPIFKEIGVLVEKSDGNMLIKIDEKDCDNEKLFFQLLKESVNIFLTSEISFHDNDEFSIKMRGHIKETLLNLKLDDNKPTKMIARKKV